MATELDDLEPIPLTALAREVAPYAVAVGRPRPSYRSIYVMVINGDLPAYQDGARWFFRRADLPEVLANLGLTPETRKRSPKARTRLSLPGSAHSSILTA